MPGGIVVKKFSGKVLKAVFDSFKPEKRMVKEAGRAWSSGEHGVLVTETTKPGIKVGKKTHVRLEKGKSSLVVGRKDGEQDKPPVSMDDLKRFMRLVGMKEQTKVMK